MGIIMMKYDQGDQGVRVLDLAMQNIPYVSWIQKMIRLHGAPRSYSQIWCTEYQAAS